MEVKTCKDCGRMFNSIGYGNVLCPTCTRKMEEKFVVVKDFIRDNPQEGINDVSKQCEVPIKIIHKWIREGRLILKDAEGNEIICEQCGKPIQTGRWCAECQNKMQQGFSDVSNSMKQDINKHKAEEEARRASTYMRTKKR